MSRGDSAHNIVKPAGRLNEISQLEIVAYAIQAHSPALNAWNFLSFSSPCLTSWLVMDTAVKRSVPVSQLAG